MDKRIEVKELTEQISRFVNTYSSDKSVKFSKKTSRALNKSVNELVEEMFKDHSTSIQQKMGFVFKLLVKAAELYEAGYHDLHNGYSLEMAKKIVDKFPVLKGGVPLI